MSYDPTGPGYGAGADPRWQPPEQSIGYPPPPQLGYPAPYPPQYAYAYPPPATTNGVGIAGFVCGLLGLIFFWFPILGIVLALLGVILSASGLNAGRRTGSSTGLAVAGLVLGIIGFLLAVIITIAVFNS